METDRTISISERELTMNQKDLKLLIFRFYDNYLIYY